jgi:hypothetical protein
MFKENLSVELTCPKHPDFNPREEHPFEGCAYCRAINYIAGWMKRSECMVDSIRMGLYEASTKSSVKEATPSTSEIAYVITDNEMPRSEEESTMKLAPLVKRKVKGGVRVKSAPRKPYVESPAEPEKPTAPPASTPADNGMLL